MARASVWEGRQAYRAVPHRSRTGFALGDRPCDRAERAASYCEHVAGAAGASQVDAPRRRM
jgi:hypothetical protein